MVRMVRAIDFDGDRKCHRRLQQNGRHVLLAAAGGAGLLSLAYDACDKFLTLSPLNAGFFLGIRAGLLAFLALIH